MNQTSVALMGEITAKDGRIQQSNYHNYPVARIHEAPREVHVTLVQNGALPAGVGEPGVPPIAPAICNAIFAAEPERSSARTAPGQSPPPSPCIRRRSDAGDREY